jgi:hypothetical protein
MSLLILLKIRLIVLKKNRNPERIANKNTKPIWEMIPKKLGSTYPSMTLCFLSLKNLCQKLSSMPIKPWYKISACKETGRNDAE